MRTIVLASVLVALSGLALGLFAATRSSQPRRVQRPRPEESTVAPTSTTTLLPRPSTARCPLTDLPARRGVARRPALLVKVGNEPFGARPQSGLGEADIVFDTPAEGFIMRYIAVYQCGSASSIGPTRSVRWVDWHLARAFIQPVLAFAGGINPNIHDVESFSWLSSANLLEAAQGAGRRITSRVPPDNLYTSTAALYSLFPREHRPPPPIFTFSIRVPGGGERVSSLGIDFSSGTDVIWRWDPSAYGWLHTYSGMPDIDSLTDKAITARNVVVLLVRYRLGPYAESRGGSGDIESETTGRGVGYVLRNGLAIKVTWHRADLIDGFTFRRGHENVALSPGRTWVELVPLGTKMRLER